jgi:hypothetical protein
MVSTFVENSPEDSVNFTVKVKLPPVVGVPVIVPVSGLKLKPAGKAPETIDQAPVAGTGEVPVVFV